jgi:uncharacterized protein (TIGR00251 family)
VPSEIRIRVLPRSSQTKIVVDGDSVKIWVTAAPTDGQANEAVIKALAKKLELAPSKVSILRGAGSREKLVGIEDLTLEEIRERLSGRC